MNKAFPKIRMRVIGVASKSLIEGIENKSFHSLRHAAISRFAAAGMTLERIGKIVAHSDPATTAAYVHP